MELWWAFLILGAAVGFFAGLLGIGGGGIMVPVLTSLFFALGFANEHIVHQALATSMASIILTAAASARSHHQHQAVLWPVAARLSIGVVVGTLLASQLASQLNALVLAVIFAVFMSYVALQMLLNLKPAPSRQLPSPTVLTGAGLGIGAMSALVAIGGGTLTVPLLTWCNVKMQQAIGTSAAVGLPIAITGTLGYVIAGWQVDGLPSYSIGYVYLPAVVFISAVSVLTAPMGVRSTHRLPVSILKKVFALLLLGLAAKMLANVVLN